MDEKRQSAAARYCGLLRRHERMLRWLCLRHAYGDPDLADDYFQEVSLTLWRHLPDLDPDLPGRQERSYVKQSARFALGHCRRGQRMDLQRLRAEMVVAFDQGDKEGEQMLNALVGSLSGDDRIVVGLYRSGYEVSEIARFLGISANAASQRLHRAVERMRAMYDKECETIKNMHHGE